MKAILAAVVAVVWWMQSPAPAELQSIVVTPPDLMAEQVSWLRARGWDARLPDEIRTVSRQEIIRMTHNPRTAGACLNGVVYLGDHLTLSIPQHASVLLHELVHIAQNGCAIPDSTRREIFEADAYATQREWLRDQGVKLVVFR